MQNLKNFNSGSKIKQATYAFIASQLLTKQEKNKIDKIFKAMDKNGDGKLSKDEIKDGYEEHFGKLMDETELMDMFDKIDVDRSGFIDYSEFVVASMNETEILSDEKLLAAFKAIDKDGNGTISSEEIRSLLAHGQNIDIEYIMALVQAVDDNGDGEL